MSDTTETKTSWFKTHQIETFVKSKNPTHELDGSRKKLVVLHECGEDKEALIEQLKTMILGLESEFDWFAG